MGLINMFRLHKLGLFCTGADDIIRLITFEQQDGTLQEANNVTDIMELNGQVSTIIFNQIYNNLFICSTQGIDIFDLITMEQKQSSLLPIALGKIVDIAFVNPANEIIVTVRDSGAIEAWSITDGSRKFSEHIENEISHVTANPILPFIVITSTTGIFYFFEINLDGFRLIHRIRVHSKDIRFIKFNSTGNLLVSTGIDNSLFLMEIRTDQTTVDSIFQIIYRTDLDGEVFVLDLDDFEKHQSNIDYDEQQHDSDDEHNTNIRKKANETRIIVALNTKTEKFGRFFIIDFDWQQYRGNKKTNINYKKKTNKRLHEIRFHISYF